MGKIGPKENYFILEKLIINHPEFRHQDYSDQLGIARQAVSRYFKEYPYLKRLQKQGRSEMKSLQKSPQILVDMLAAEMLKKAYEGDEGAARLAHEFVSKNNNRGIVHRGIKNWKNIFFVAYEAFKEKNETGEFPTQTDLANRLGVNQPFVHEYFKRLGIESNHNPVFNGTERDEALIMGYKHGVSVPSLIYFLDLPNRMHTVSKAINREEIERDNSLIRIYSNRVGEISLHNASQFYEAVGLDFDIEESSELVDISLNSGISLVENYEEIMPVITGALQVLFDEPNYDLPYLNDDLRKKVRGWNEK